MPKAKKVVEPPKVEPPPPESDSDDLPESDDWETKPEFIYGGPFIKPMLKGTFIDAAAPRNIPLSGTFRQSFAYYSLKERMPIILTKVIDSLSRRGDEHSISLIQFVSKLKSDLITNKEYTPLEVNTPEAKKWNEWIAATDNHHYFNNTWLFTECYVYRKLREGCELFKMEDYDPFAEMKEKSFSDLIEPICIAGAEVLNMLKNPQNKNAQFATLLKLSLWANKCDLSLSAGDPVTIKNSGGKLPVLNPLKLIDQYKDRILADHTSKIKLEAIKPGKQFDPNDPGPYEPEPPAAEGEPPKPRIPCPAKVVNLTNPNFDIVTDNAGYELFIDLCIGDFLITNEIVQKVRYHVKKIPWFVSDVTPKDFHYVIGACAGVNYARTVPPEMKEGAPGEPPTEVSPALNISSQSIQTLAERWQKYIKEGKFILMSDEFWTTPHPFNDMKKYDFNMYRKLQFASTILFKGDLNYRKLVGEINWNPYTPFDKALQGFYPAPIIAVRTVKSECVAGLGKGKFEFAKNRNPNWMRTGDFGVIQYCKKKDPLKVSDKPCLDYGQVCFGEECPIHKDMW